MTQDSATGDSQPLDPLKPPPQLPPPESLPKSVEVPRSLIDDIIDLKSRLSALEMAVGSLAGPTISQDSHDGLGLLHKWWSEIKDEFQAVAAAHKEVQVKVLQAAQAAARAKPRV